VKQYTQVSFETVTGSHDARERLVAAAEDLVRRSGPRSVSMDTAAAAAGAGKMSAYRHFTDRGHLVAAALERYNPRHVRWLVGDSAAATAAPGTAAAPGAAADRDGPLERILSVFDRLEAAAAGENFRGCPFVDAALAAPAADQRIGGIAARHKQDLAEALTGLAVRAGLRAPVEVAAAVALVIDGAAVQSALIRDPDARRAVVRRGRHIAGVLLASAAQAQVWS
jgi:AcrR family transcriptional regulator